MSLGNKNLTYPLSGLKELTEECIFCHYLTTKSSVYVTELKPNVTTSNYGDPFRNKFQFKGMITGYYRLPCRLGILGCIRLFDTNQMFKEIDRDLTYKTYDAPKKKRTKRKGENMTSFFTNLFFFSHSPPTKAPIHKKKMDYIYSMLQNINTAHCCIIVFRSWHFQLTKK